MSANKKMPATGSTETGIKHHNNEICMSDPIVSNETFPVNQQSASPAGLCHGFDIGYAMAYGVEEAIMIKNFQHFIMANATRGHNFREGRYWTYDRLEDFPRHFPYWTAKQIRRILVSLVDQGVIIKGEFNSHWSNRTQWYAFKDQDHFLKFLNPPETPLPVDPHLTKWENGRFSNGKMADSQMGACLNDTTSITTSISSSSSLKVPTEPVAAKAAACEKKSPSKQKREKGEHSPKVREVANQLLNLLRKHSAVYRPPSDFTKFLDHVRDLIETDAQDVDTVLKLFEWAVKDNEQRGTFNGWKGVIVSNVKGGRPTTPIAIFRKYLGKIEADMKARPKRKFCASHNEEAALEAIADMNSRAI